MNFKSFNSSDIELLQPLFKNRTSFTCENTIANIAIWAGEYDMEFAIEKADVYIKIAEKNGYIFSIPVCSDLKRAVTSIKQYCAKEDIPAKFWFEEGQMLDEFLNLYKGEYLCFNSRNSSEYIYKRENLANLVGKKFHSKRNHISSFTKKYNWTFEKLNNDNIADARFVADGWYAANVDPADTSASAENVGISFLLDHMDIFKVQGGILRVDGQPVAFTCGTPINDKVFDVNFEKALPEYQGAYAVINREFAKSLNYEFLNREDDLGLPGLRKAKLSYHPDIILKKYICLPRELYNQSRELHLSVFPEDDFEFATQLLDNFFAENCFYKYLNGKIVSQLFVMDSVVNGISSGYVYAAATDEEYRRLGYMAELIETVKKHYGVITLKPAAPDLYGFYAKFGFKEAFYCDVLNIKINCKESIAAQKIEEIELFKQVRESLLPEPHQLLCDDALKLVINNYLIYTDSTEQPKFLAICRKEESRLIISEFIADGYCNEIITGLAGAMDCESVTAYIHSPQAADKFGMLYSNTDIMPHKMFMGIALD